MVGSNGRDDVISIERRLIHDGAVSVLMDGTKAPEVPFATGGIQTAPPRPPSTLATVLAAIVAGG